MSKKYYYPKDSFSTKESFKNHNYIEKLKITVSSDFPESSSKFGKMHEETIANKSLLNLPIEQINSSYLFSDNKRMLKGLKLVVFPYDARLFEIKQALNENKYKVIPYLKADFEVKYETEKFCISYYNDEISFDKGVKFYIEKIGYKDNNIPQNIYEYTVKLNNCRIYLFSFWCEVDGIFRVRKDFLVKDYDISVLFSKNDDNYKPINVIRKDSIMIYEIKNNANIYELENQIYIKNNFISKLLKIFPEFDKKLIFIGFVRYCRIKSYKFDLLKYSRINLIIFNIDDTLFREKLWMNNEVLNSLKDIKEKVTEVDAKIDKVLEIFQEIKNAKKI